MTSTAILSNNNAETRVLKCVVTCNCQMLGRSGKFDMFLIITMLGHSRLSTIEISNCLEVTHKDLWMLTSPFRWYLFWNIPAWTHKEEKSTFFRNKIVHHPLLLSYPEGTFKITVLYKQRFFIPLSKNTFWVLILNTL